jgi:hypothetical protein
MQRTRALTPREGGGGRNRLWCVELEEEEVEDSVLARETRPW